MSYKDETYHLLSTNDDDDAGAGAGWLDGSRRTLQVEPTPHYMQGCYVWSVLLCSPGDTLGVCPFGRALELPRPERRQVGQLTTESTPFRSAALGGPLYAKLEPTTTQKVGPNSRGLLFFLKWDLSRWRCCFYMFEWRANRDTDLFESANNALSALAVSR